MARTSASDLPWPIVVLVTAGTSLGIGVGMLVDASVYFAHKQAGDLSGDAAEWIGFTIILIVMFLIPRLPRREKS